MVASSGGSPLRELVELYGRLSALDTTPGSGHRARNAVSDRIAAVLPGVLADPALLDQLREIGRTHPDPLVRGYAGDDADPPPPTTPEDLPAWLAHPGVGLAELAGDARPAIALMPQALDPARAEDRELLAAAAEYDEYHDSSWLGGAPSGPLPDWPRRADGVALVHVAQVDLRSWAWLAAQLPGLPLDRFPPRGVLQVFHDLETPGDAPGDGDRGAWQVRWVESPGAPVTPPPDAAGPTRVHALLSQEAVGTLPCPDDLADDRLAAGAELARRRLLAAQRAVGTGDRDLDLSLLRPQSQLFGHAWSSEREARERLATAAATATNDWLLLADVAGVGPLDSWFGDEGHLEVWMRSSDVARSDFSRAWVLLRS